MSETAQEAARRLAGPTLAKGFKPVALHTYTDREGAPLYWRIRAKHPGTGEKWIRPMKLNGHGFEMGEPKFEGLKPLYALAVIAKNPDSLVMVAEGEQKADALIKLGLVATTSGGATSAASADWEQLRGRQVCIFPDNDDAGKAYAGEVASILLGMGCTVTCIDVEKLGLGNAEDVIDWLASHTDAIAADILGLPILTPQPRDVSPPATIQSRERFVTLLGANEIEPEAIYWLWQNWIAAGKFHILGGAPGTGKTTLAIAMAATVSSGGRWPDATRATIGNVLIWSGEDDPANSLVPRLIASGANLNRVKFVAGTDGIGGKQPFDPAHDMARLTDAALAIGDVRLLIVDPVVSAVAGDSHKNGETRRALQPLVDLGAALNCAVLGITHFSKGTGGRDPTERITGSIAFAALARVVLIAAKKTQIEDGEPGRMLARSKSNIGPDDGGFAYDLAQMELPAHPGVFASHVLWGNALEGSAREMLATADMSDDEGGGELDGACVFLSDLLRGGAVATKDIQARARDAGISWSTTKRAKKLVGVEAIKVGMNGGWAWQLERRGSTKPEDTQQNSVGTFEKNEHLRRSAEESTDAGEVF